jgi:hypothetical protein
MKLVQALNYGTRAMASGLGRVLHHSSRAANIAFGERVVTLLNQKGLSAPSSIVAGMNSIPRISYAYFEDGLLKTNLFAVKLNNPLDFKLTFILNAPVSELLTQLRPLLGKRDYSISNAVLLLEGEKISVSGIDKVVTDREMQILKNANDLSYAIKHLLGLGFGLTPSGDDFVIGLIAAHNLLNLDTAYIRRIVRPYQYAFSRTLLEDALDMYYPEALYNLLKSVRDGRLLQTRAERLLEMGHSSGSDIISGLYYGLKCLDSPELNSQAGLQPASLHLDYH